MMRIRAFLLAMALIGAILTGASYAGSLWWGFEILSHFRVQFALAGLLVFLAGAFSRSAWAAMIALGAAVGNGVSLWPYEAERPIAAPAAGQTLRVVTANLRGGAGATAQFRLLIAAEQPDILVLSELPSASAAILRPLAAALPHLSFEGNPTGFDTVILSRWPLRDVVIDRSVHPRLPVTRATLCIERDNCLTLIAMHASPPLWTANDAALRDAALLMAGQWARDAYGRVIVAGDLNLTPWSPVFTELLSRGRLRDSAAGRGVQATWPALAGPLGIAIDHIMIGDRIAVRDRRVGDGFGSNHRPIIADLVIR